MVCTQRVEERVFFTARIIEQRIVVVVSFSFVVDEHACTCFVSGEFQQSIKFPFFITSFFFVFNQIRQTQQMKIFLMNKRNSVVLFKNLFDGKNKTLTNIISNCLLLHINYINAFNLLMQNIKNSVARKLLTYSSQIVSNLKWIRNLNASTWSHTDIYDIL